MRHCVPLVALVALIPVGVAADDVRLHGHTVVHFATAREGTELLAARDGFIRHLSRFDRQVRMHTSREVSDEEFLKFITSEVRPWEASDVTKLAGIIQSIRQELLAWVLPLPERIFMVHTTGREEAGAAYCRGNAIILPPAHLRQDRDQLKRLLVHELFHILSSQNPELRQRLYAIIGFHPSSEIVLPPSFESRRITNPDAPSHNWQIQLQWQDRQIHAVPLVYASTQQYSAEKRRSLFDYVTFRLLVVEQRGGEWFPVIENDQPLLLRAEEVPDYGRQIGQNTKYIIHPEEILAENFVHLVGRQRELPSPWVATQMDNLLKRDPGEDRGNK